MAGKYRRWRGTLWGDHTWGTTLPSCITTELFIAQYSLASTAYLKLLIQALEDGMDVILDGAHYPLQVAGFRRIWRDL